MDAAYAYSALLVTVGLALARPRIRAERRLGLSPAAAVGALMMLIFGVVRFHDVVEAAVIMARPLIALAAIMATAAIVERARILDGLAAWIDRVSGGSTQRLFALTFVFAAVTAAILNNDAAILLLTPLFVDVVRRRNPNAPGLVVAFAFAVFMSAGVAPFLVSNPMNMVFAEYAGLGFNAYAAEVGPIAVASAVVTFVALRILFRRDLAAAATSAAHPPPAPAARTDVLAVLVIGLAAHPVIAYLGGPLWLAPLATALAAFGLTRRQLERPLEIVTQGISWQILGFLFFISIMGVGFRNAGFVARLAALYAETGLLGIGVISAVGSAILNNHPMSVLNMLTLAEGSGTETRALLAAMIGGDLGPRLLPTGSLAGLLWVESLARSGVNIPVWRFALYGTCVTIPTLAVALLLLGA